VLTDRDVQLIQQAQGLLYASNPQGAKDLLEPIVQKQATFPEAWKWLGFAHVALQDFPAAEDAFAKSVAMAPDDAMTHYGRGQLLAVQNRLLDAVSAYDRALEVQPGFDAARSALVDALIALGSKEFAMYHAHQGQAFLDRAIKLSHGSPTAYIALIKGLVDNNDRGRAKQQVGLALKANPHSQELQMWAANLGVQSLTPTPPSQVAAAVPTQPPVVAAQAPAPQVAYAASPAPSAAIAAPSPVSPAPAPAQAPAKQIPCRACKRLISEWTFVCPHCGERLRESARSIEIANIKAPWQEVAYKIVAVLWILLGLFTVWQGYYEVRVAENEAIRDGYEAANVFTPLLAYFVIVALIRIGIGVGLLMENEFVQGIAKFICFLAILDGLLRTLSFTVGDVAGGVAALIQLVVAGFTLYLINFVGGDGGYT
jgi:tetratricopeptide (TPR) repeat protein